MGGKCSLAFFACAMMTNRERAVRLAQDNAAIPPTPSFVAGVPAYFARGIFRMRVIWPGANSDLTTGSTIFRSAVSEAIGSIAAGLE